MIHLTTTYQACGMRDHAVESAISRGSATLMSSIRGEVVDGE